MPNPDWNWDAMYNICRKVTRDTDGDGALDQFIVIIMAGWMQFILMMVKSLKKMEKKAILQKIRL